MFVDCMMLKNESFNFVGLDDEIRQKLLPTFDLYLNLYFDSTMLCFLEIFCKNSFPRIVGKIL